MYYTLLLLLSSFSRIRLCATPEMAAQQALPSMGFSRQEHRTEWVAISFSLVLHTSLHLIAIFWKNFNVEEIGCLLVRPMFYVFVFLFIMESHLCVLRLIFDKDSKGSLSSCGTFSLNSSFLFDALHTDYSLPGLTTHQCSQFRFLPECLWLLCLQLQRENPLKTDSCGVIRLMCVFTFTQGTYSWNPNTACCSGSENHFLFCSAF